VYSAHLQSAARKMGRMIRNPFSSSFITGYFPPLELIYFAPVILNVAHLLHHAHPKHLIPMLKHHPDHPSTPPPLTANHPTFQDQLMRQNRNSHLNQHADCNRPMEEKSQTTQADITYPHGFLLSGQQANLNGN
ncbi:MAG: hypothetical protein Q9M30_08290, partial [Mariprofundaceae bacterium]|nr:hypothetical protein [Mariprofundaceae bacterium]